jgi:hypothetical protein
MVLALSLWNDERSFLLYHVLLAYRIHPLTRNVNLTCSSRMASISDPHLQLCSLSSISFVSRIQNAHSHF